MNIDTLHNTSYIAAFLARNFVKPLYDFCNEKNFFVYTGCFDEIVSWAHEFYNQHYEQINDWEVFKRSNDNIYNAVSPYGFLMAWGDNKMKSFFVQHPSASVLAKEIAMNFNEEEI